MENDKAIYRMNFDCGRMGSINGVFVASKDAVEKLVDSGKQIYFGEVLGKHSEIVGALSRNEIKMVTDDPAAIKIFEEFKFASGHNPFHYLEADDGE